MAKEASLYFSFKLLYLIQAAYVTSFEVYQLYGCAKTFVNFNKVILRNKFLNP